MFVPDIRLCVLDLIIVQTITLYPWLGKHQGGGRRPLRHLRHPLRSDYHHLSEIIFYKIFSLYYYLTFENKFCKRVEDDMNKDGVIIDKEFISSRRNTLCTRNAYKQSSLSIRRVF